MGKEVICWLTNMTDRQMMWHDGDVKNRGTPPKRRRHVTQATTTHHLSQRRLIARPAARIAQRGSVLPQLAAYCRPSLQVRSSMQDGMCVDYARLCSMGHTYRSGFALVQTGLAHIHCLSRVCAGERLAMPAPAGPFPRDFIIFSVFFLLENLFLNNNRKNKFF